MRQRPYRDIRRVRTLHNLAFRGICKTPHPDTAHESQHSCLRDVVLWPVGGPHGTEGRADAVDRDGPATAATAEPSQAAVRLPLHLTTAKHAIWK